MSSARSGVDLSRALYDEAAKLDDSQWQVKGLMKMAADVLARSEKAKCKYPDCDCEKVPGQFCAAEQPRPHTGHPERHWDRTCPGCIDEGYDMAGDLRQQMSERADKPRSFSDFIRNASPEEKAEVYDDVMKKAGERQERVTNKQNIDPLDRFFARWGEAVGQREDLRAILLSSTSNVDAFAEWLWNHFKGSPYQQRDIEKMIAKMKRDLGSSSATSFKPTHRHADGGVYRAVCDSKFKGVTTEWIDVVIYEAEDRKLYVTTPARWADRFKALAPDSRATTGEKK